MSDVRGLIRSVENACEKSADRMVGWHDIYDISISGELQLLNESVHKLATAMAALCDDATPPTKDSPDD